MRRLLRAFVAGLLVGCLVAGPALASPERPLGSVIYADRARLGSSAAAGGATVFAGDQVATDEVGTLRIRLGSGQIYLPANSAAALEEMSGGIGARLLRGRVDFSSSGESAVMVLASEALVRPKTTQPTRGQVQLVSPRELIIASYHGPMEVIVGSQTYLVAETTSYRVILDPQGPQGTGAPGAAHSRALWIVLGAIGVAAVVGVAVWRANTSNRKP